MKPELSPKERRFVIEFLKDQNAKQAAIRAGYSKKTAETQGPRLYRKVQVRDAVDFQLSQIKNKNLLTAELVRAKVFALLTFDPRKAFDERDGTMKRVDQMPDDLVTALAGVDIDDSQGEVKKIKFTDRIRAAELAAKILGMLTLQDDGDGNAPLLVAKIDFAGLTRDELRALARMRQSNAIGKAA